MDGIQVVRVPAWPRERDWYFAPGIFRLIQDSGADIIHCQGYHTFVAPLAMGAALNARIPYLLSFHSGGHSSSLRHRTRRVHWEMLRPLLIRADRLIAVSKFEAELFQSSLRLPASLVAVVPNGANIELDSDQVAHADPDLILSVGRLEAYKGHQRVLRALPHVIARRPRTRLIILGSGPLHGELTRLAAELGCRERVEIVSFPSNQRRDIARLVKTAGLVVFFSEYEAHSVAAIEALFLGRPVLVVDSTGLHELVQRGLALGVPVDADSSAIGDAMLAQLESPFVPPQVDLPTWENCAAELLDIYSSILLKKSEHREKRRGGPSRCP